jgi:hypothetical protein
MLRPLALWGSGCDRISWWMNVRSLRIVKDQVMLHYSPLPNRIIISHEAYDTRGHVR